MQGTQSSENIEVRHSGGIFLSNTDISLGSIRSRHVELLELFRTESIHMDLAISSVDPSAHTSVQQCVLQVILYGDKDLSCSLKDVLRGQDLFLQDPYGARRDVLYWNPQKYCNPTGTRTSHFSHTNNKEDMTVKEADHLDSLAAFTSGNDMPETEPSSHVRTPLKP